MSTKSDMPKKTLEEKRLENLRRQLSGKSHRQEEVMEKVKTTGSFSFSSSSQSLSSSALKADTAYLRTDLLKILFLSSIAITVEVSLHFLFQSHILNLGSLHF